MAELGVFVGALIPTFLISRLALWLLRTWDGGTSRLIAVHAASLLLISFIAGIGMADYGAFAGVRAITTYSLPQAVWLIVDLVRFTHRNPASRPQDVKQNTPTPGAHYQIMWFTVAVIAVVLVSVAIVQFGAQQRVTAPNPWDRSWEAEYVAPAEAPADAAALPAETPPQEQERSGAFDDLIAEPPTPQP
jgi:hypothetical protein